MSSDMPSPHDALRLLLPPPLNRERLRAQLAGRGLYEVSSARRASSSFWTQHFRDRTTHDGHATYVGYQEDHILGQGWVWLAGPGVPTLSAWLQAEWGAYPLATALQRAAAAERPDAVIAAWGAVCVLLAWETAPDPSALALCARLLHDPNDAVRQAALCGASYLLFPSVTDLIAACRDDATLTPEVDRQLSLRPAAAHGSPPPDSHEDSAILAAFAAVEAELAADPLAPDGYARHARLLADVGQQAWALVDVHVALALGRREGRALGELVGLADGLRAAQAARALQGDGDARAPGEPALPLAVDRLGLLLHAGRFHEVVEIADALIQLSVASAAPLQVALALAHHALGRGAQAVSTLADALAHPLQLLLGASPGGSPGPAWGTPWVDALSLYADWLHDLGDLGGAADVLLRLWWVVPAGAGMDAGPVAESPETAALTELLADRVAESLQGLRRDFIFRRAQILADLEQADAALATLDLLLAEEPDAADAWLARAALLSRCGQPELTLSACAQAERCLRPIDRLLEDVDPRALLQVRQAAALIQLPGAPPPVGWVVGALTDDPRSVAVLLSEPALLAWVATDADLAALVVDARAAASAIDVDADFVEKQVWGDRTLLRHAAAPILRSLSPQGAMRPLLADFFSATLTLLDEPSESPVRLPRGMALLTSIERQIDLLAAIDDPEARQPTVREALAAAAEALGL